MKKKKGGGQTLHFRAWKYGRAYAACQGGTTNSATTTPDQLKVNCTACKAKVVVPA